MMAGMPPNFSPHPGGMQHPGVQVHPGMVHPQQGGQPGMPQQMHMGVPGPGVPQMQPGAMMNAMGGPSQHAMQHLTPGGNVNAHFMQQQQQQHQQQQMPQFATSLAQQQFFAQQQQQQRQRALQMQLQQATLQNAGMNPGMMGNAMNPQAMNAQMAAMQARMVGQPGMQRVGVNLPQHLQQAQAQAQAQSMAQHNQQQEAQAQAQAQQHHQQQQQQLLQQQLAMQGAQQQQAAGQQQPSAQQLASMQNAQIQHAQHQHAQAQAQAQHVQQQQQQAQAQQAANAVTQQQNQSMAQGQSQPQQAQQQAQQNQAAALQQAHARALAQQPQGQGQIQASGPGQAQSIQAQNMNNLQLTIVRQQHELALMKGQCTLILKSFGDQLSCFTSETKPLSYYMQEGKRLADAKAEKSQEDMDFWHEFVAKFFSANAALKLSLIINEESGETKQFEVRYPALARYWNKQFEGDITEIALLTGKSVEYKLPLGAVQIVSDRATFLHWYDDSRVIHRGQLKVTFDAAHKIESFDFAVTQHEETLSRKQVITAARPLHEWTKEWKAVNATADGKSSPELTKKGKARQMKSPSTAPPELDLPQSKLHQAIGITMPVFQLLEMLETFNIMGPLMQHSAQNSNSSVRDSLLMYNRGHMSNGNPQPRTPSMNHFPLGQSPAMGGMALPDGGQGMMGSPGIGIMQAPNMMQQMSQQGTSSSGPSANTSPNQTTKRRRPSGIKTEDIEGATSIGMGAAKVKPSPRMQKRQKGAPA